MKKRTPFLLVFVILFGYWLFSSAKELYVLMNKYPKEFKQQGTFSFYRFYNTYRTLSFSEVMVQRGYVHHDYCFDVGFEGAIEKARLAPLIEADYQEYRKSRPDWPSSLGNIDSITESGPSCLKNAKLINFEFNCKEAYATYACELNDNITEFTYTANRNEKCSVMSYKKSWGIEPKRTLESTYRTEMWFPKSIFDSPECEPINH